MASPRYRRMWILIAVLGLVALALGLWNLLVEQDGGVNLLWQVALPALLLVIAWIQARKEDAPAPVEEPRQATMRAAATKPQEETPPATAPEPPEEGRAFPADERRGEAPAPEGGASEYDRDDRV